MKKFFCTLRGSFYINDDMGVVFLGFGFIGTIVYLVIVSVISSFFESIIESARNYHWASRLIGVILFLLWPVFLAILYYIIYNLIFIQKLDNKYIDDFVLKIKRIEKDNPRVKEHLKNISQKEVSSFGDYSYLLYLYNKPAYGEWEDVKQSDIRNYIEKSLEDKVSEKEDDAV